MQRTRFELHARANCFTPPCPAPFVHIVQAMPVRWAADPWRAGGFGHWIEVPRKLQRFHPVRAP